MSGPPRPDSLAGNQADAVAPADSVWLSASAGTGKTQVLSARVLRLLLSEGVTPDAILCLTFTKAGATEMAARINEKLAKWVRLDDTRLYAELAAIGAPSGPDDRARARRLFAQVLDCPGGGLRIDTIHAFSQWLLAAFPEEAGLIPGSRPMEDRERALLARQVLADLLVDAEARGDQALLDAVARLSLRMGPDDVEHWLLRCASAREAWFGPGGWSPPLRPHVHRLLELPSDADLGWVASHCADDMFDTEALRCCHAAYAQWNTKTGREASAVIADWLGANPTARLAALDDLYKILFTLQDTIRSETSLTKFEESFVEAALAVQQSATAAREARAMLDLAAWLAPALELGRRFALAWDDAKNREGLIDFDDQIRRAADLLDRAGMADWIRYKLDRRFDHVLIDEAQDTNAAQWRIIRALTAEFFAGEGTHHAGVRTLFVVGDYKQAIFGFQGTSPENFELARRHFRDLMREAAANARKYRGGPDLRELVELGLDRSFRTGQPVLDFVDRAIRQIGPRQFGLDRDPETHQGDARAGQVVLWRPVGTRPEDGDDPDHDAESGEETWLSRPERELADKLARQIRSWLETGFPLVKRQPRNASAGDIMILVRKRGDLAGLIVARLHAAGVPVAGVDRLRLGAPLAVRDLIAALRFAAQPLDDLTLASLLVSPLIGWSQDQLLEHGWRAKGAPLWQHLRRTSHPDVAAAMVLLTDLLARADYEPVQALLHWLLVGPWQGRRHLVARLGSEANDPIDELVNAAHAFAASATPSLVGFLAWFEAGAGELKREADGGGGLVRVMTVHGSKGLQAPIVILADATGDPERGRGSALDLPDPAAQLSGQSREIPLPSLRRQEKAGPILRTEAEIAAAEAEEHWRLLYVAMTRAEEALYVTGALGRREKTPAPASWFAHLAQIEGGSDWLEDPIWGARLEHGQAPPPVPRAAEARQLPMGIALPGWLTRPAGAEPRPPKPLAPSSAGEDFSPDPPMGSASPALLAQAARRGTLVHKLLERLPALAPEGRAAAARTWLARQAADLGEMARDDIAASALAVIADPRWADLFGPDALAEVPIAATVAERVIAGAIDRLLVTPQAIRFVDFKSARRPPETLAQVPVAILRQLAAYALALEAAYPGRAIEAALLYTQIPRLIEIPAELLETHKHALATAQESFAL